MHAIYAREDDNSICKSFFGEGHTKLFNKEVFQTLVSEVSKRGWRTEGVGARKSLPHHKFRSFFCPLSLCPLRSRKHNSGGHFLLYFGRC